MSERKHPSAVAETDASFPIGAETISGHGPSRSPFPTDEPGGSAACYLDELATTVGKWPCGRPRHRAA
jgi:hypothetical protein